MESKLTETKVKILLLLSLKEKTWRELKEETGLSDPVLAKHIKELLRMNLITEEIDPDDRRKKIYKPNIDEIKKACNIDEFIKKYEEDNPDWEHFQVLQVLTNFVALQGSVDEELQKYLLKPYLAGWIEFDKSGEVKITKKGWRAIFKWLPTRQLQTIQLIELGKDLVELDDEMIDYIINLKALANLTSKELDELIPDDSRKLVADREKHLKKELKKLK